MQPASGARLVRVSFAKGVSDGNYGTERAEVSLDWYVTEDELLSADTEAAISMLAQARELVLNELRRSPSAAVRRAVETMAPQPIAERAPRTTAPPPAQAEDDDLAPLPF
jgi:hypothetical protein